MASDNGSRSGRQINKPLRRAHLAMATTAMHLVRFEFAVPRRRQRARRLCARQAGKVTQSWDATRFPVSISRQCAEADGNPLATEACSQLSRFFADQSDPADHNNFIL